MSCDGMILPAPFSPPPPVPSVCKAFGGRQVLRYVDLDVYAGTLVGVVGENGAGKSTLLQIAVGHLAPDRGTAARTGAVGYCPQRAVLNDGFTVGQQLRLFQMAYRPPHSPPFPLPGVPQDGGPGRVIAVVRR
ncbi:ATP-binding cassette domain-containing protein [Streptomyces luteogriseus]|uniref:ATP-binding cassette domain-containing protein n=1 Tax=Streptomyces luteogriseus TaxID=68233 RepID=UPI00380EE816